MYFIKKSEKLFIFFKSRSIKANIWFYQKKENID